MTVPFCKDCKHFRVGVGIYMCNKPGRPTGATNVVTGQKERHATFTDAAVSRSAEGIDACGPDGVFFTPVPVRQMTWIERLLCWWLGVTDAH